MSLRSEGENTAKARSLFFQALANRNRQRIIDLLLDGEKTVSEIGRSLRLEQSAISHSLRCLLFCGFVKSRRVGRNRVYYVSSESLREIIRLADEHIAMYASKLYECDFLER